MSRCSRYMWRLELVWGVQVYVVTDMSRQISGLEDEERQNNNLSVALTKV
jgi:hypothetical protein